MEQKNTKRDHKSIVWDYFKKVDNISARCKLCTKMLKHGGNTTNLMQHLKRKHILYLQSDTTPQCQKTSDTEKPPSTKKRIYEINEEQEENNNPELINDVSSSPIQHKVIYNF